MKHPFLFLATILLTITLSAQKLVTPAPWTGIKFENRAAMPKAPACNGSEAYLKKKIKALLAVTYKDYPWIWVDFKSFKGQNGYTDKLDSSRIVYPYKIEMQVYLKRTIVKEEKDRTEYTVWKYDAEYEYSTKPKKNCAFRMVPSSQVTLVTREDFAIK